MKRLGTAGTALVLVALAAVAAPTDAQQGRRGGWQGCCGAAAWPWRGDEGRHPRGAMPGRGMMGGSMARHRVAMSGGIPAPYGGLTNPAPPTAATVEHGARIYGEHCASCHGATGHGDGPAAAPLDPRPANLAWMSRVPMSRWDAFMFWTVSEGGAPVGSAMPAFKDTLTEADRWAVIAYVQAHLPRAQPAR